MRSLRLTRRQSFVESTVAPPMVTLVHITTVPVTLWSFFRGQAAFLRDRGISVSAVSAPGVYLDQFGADERVPVYPVQMDRRIQPLRDVVTLGRMVRLLARLRPDIVHTHTPKGGLIGMIAARVCRVPIRIYHIHGLPFVTARGRRRWVLRVSEWISCWCAHQVFCVSPSIRDVAVSERLCPAGKIVVPALGSFSGVDAQVQFDPGRFGVAVRAAARRALGIGPRDVVVGFVGRIVRDKGVVELALAWHSLGGPGVCLVLVGSIETEDRVSDQVMTELRSDPRVRFLAHVDDPAPLYAVMDIVVLPTHREGFPVVPLEAAAMALPIVATRIPGCVDAIMDGVTGTLVSVGDPAALEAALRSYIDDDRLRERHGTAARQRVLQNYRPEDVWQATYDLYHKLMFTHRVGGQGRR